MLKLKEMDAFTIEDMKVFRLDDMQWVAVPTLLHALAFLEEQIGEIDVSHLAEVEEADIKTQGMWDSGYVTEKEVADFENGKLELYEPKKHIEWHEARKPSFGVYGTFAGELCKYTSFEDVLKKEGVGTYIIASTEY